MKRTIAFTALALSVLTGAASAMTGNDSSANQVILERYAPGIEVSALTNTQVATLLNIVYSDDSAGEKRSKIQHFAN